MGPHVSIKIARAAMIITGDARISIIIHPIISHILLITADRHSNSVALYLSDRNHPILLGVYTISSRK